MASLAEMERELMVERTQAGLAAARKLGRTGGRRRRMTDGKITAARRLLAGGVPPRDVAKNLGVSIPTLYRWVPAAGAAGLENEKSHDFQPDGTVSSEMQRLGKPATDKERERSRERLLTAAQLRDLSLRRGDDAAGSSI